MTASRPRPEIRAARPADWPAIERLLSERGLPVAGARDHLGTFVVAELGSGVVGCAGVERYGEVGLLRSLAVTEALGGRGTGSALVQATLARARALGIRNLYLLTTTAADFFPRFGFETIARESVPASLAVSEELQGACPASAVAMRLTLRGSP